MAKTSLPLSGVYRLIEPGPVVLVAEALNTDCDAVKQLVKHVLRKLGLTDRTQATLWAIRNDLA